MRRMLPAPSAMLGERELLLVRLLVLARIIAHPGAGAALHLYEIFQEFGLCHMRMPGNRPMRLVPSLYPKRRE